MAIDLSAEIESPEVKPDTVKPEVKPETALKGSTRRGKTDLSVSQLNNEWETSSLAPAAPGLAEQIAINILTSAMKEQVSPPDSTESRLPLVGDQVFWYQGGEQRNKPCPAIVNMTPDWQRVLSLTVFTVNGPIVKDGVKHLSVDASPRDRELYGGWAWNRDGKSSN